MASRYVEVLEQQQAQLVAGLQELYRRTQDGQGWEGAPLRESIHGAPLTHDILESLGALRSGTCSSEPQQFEEDVEFLQRRLHANGAGFIQRTPSDSGSDSSHSPSYEQRCQRPPFSEPFSLSKLPPTPPSQSPLSHSPLSQNFEPKVHGLSLPPSLPKATDNLPQCQLWASSRTALSGNANVYEQYDSPISMQTGPNPFDCVPMPIGTIAPYLSMRDWNHDVDFQRYFSPTTM